MSESRSEFEAWWAHERDQNSGVAIGADYRHWALLGYREGRRIALAEAEAACEKVGDEYDRTEGHRYPELKSDAVQGARSCEAAIRSLAQTKALEG